MHRAEAGAAPATAAAHPLVPVAVVSRALLGIAQHLVGLGHELEALLGRLVAVVAVGVALHGELAVGFLDVGFGAVARHAEHVVEVLLHLTRATPRPAATCD